MLNDQSESSWYVFLISEIRERLNINMTSSDPQMKRILNVLLETEYEANTEKQNHTCAEMILVLN